MPPPVRLALAVELGTPGDAPAGAGALHAALDLPLLRARRRAALGRRRRGAGARLRRRPRRPGRRGVRAERAGAAPDRAPPDRAGQRPVRRRQGLRSCGALEDIGLRGDRQPAAADDRGNGRPRRAGSGAPLAVGRGRPLPRLRRRGGAGDAGAAARQPGAAPGTVCSPGPTRPRCCAATPKPAAAIRWRRRAGSATASPPSRR